MLLQKAQIGKTAVILIILNLLAALAAMPLFLQAESTGETTPEANLFLPAVYNDANSTPNPVAGATPTPTSSHTPTPTNKATNAPTDVPTATNTSITPPIADLIVGRPILISTPPIIVYEPVSFQVPVTNTGDIAIEDLFFVDLLFDPQSGHPTDVYAAVSSLNGNSSITLTITSTIGFANFVGTHQVMGWVDSLDHIVEADETNNLSSPLDVPIDNFGGTPTNTPTPDGTETISGNVLLQLIGLLPIERAAVTLIDETSGNPIASTYSGEIGAYSLNNIATGSGYTVQACIFIDNQPYFGVNTGVTAPEGSAHIILQAQPCP